MLGQGELTLPTQGGHPWTRITDDTSSDRPFKRKVRVWQRRIGHMIETRRAHLLILFLLTVDSACVLADLGYSLLSNRCDEHQLEPTWLNVLSHISLAITSIFLLEILFALFAFGPCYYNPFGAVPLATLHLFDAFIIVSTFVLEIALKGREEELAALLIILRFWRIIKLMEGVALGAGELNAEEAAEFASTKEELRRIKTELVVSQDRVQKLRLRLQAAGIPLEEDPHNAASISSS